MRPLSDHASFSRYGYYAIHARENLNVYNPFYHTIGDTIGSGFNALLMCYQGIRAAVATVATLARPYRTKIEETTPTALSYPKLDIPSIIKVGQGFKIRYLAHDMTEVKFLISNALGQIELSRLGITNDRGIAETALTNNLTPGVYFVRCETKDATLIKKFVVIR